MNPTVWIAKDAAGEVRGGCGDWAAVLAKSGWTDVAGTPSEHMREALGEICLRASGARLLHCEVSTAPWWTDAPGPWRIEAPLRVLWPEDEG